MILFFIANVGNIAGIWIGLECADTCGCVPETRKALIGFMILALLLQLLFVVTIYMGYKWKVDSLANLALYKYGSIVGLAFVGIIGNSLAVNCFETAQKEKSLNYKPANARFASVMLGFNLGLVITTLAARSDSDVFNT